MTAQDFKVWLDGFLDGKETLSAEQVSRLRDEASKVGGLPQFYGPIPYAAPLPSPQPVWVANDPLPPNTITC